MIIDGLWQMCDLNTSPQCCVMLDSWMCLLLHRLNFSTAFSTNAVSICHSIGLTQVSRVECSVRYLLDFSPEGRLQLSEAAEAEIVHLLHDKMTQCRYLEPITSFQLDVHPEEVYEVDVIGQGRAALEEANTHLGLAPDFVSFSLSCARLTGKQIKTMPHFFVLNLGLAFDDWDLQYYTDLFSQKVKRNPTSVECFDLAQSNRYDIVSS